MRWMPIVVLATTSALAATPAVTLPQVGQPEILQRGQPHTTFTLLFNSIYQGTI